MNQNYLFFNASRETFNQFTSLFDFLWPTAAAMWNLRWQVNGYLIAKPEATVQELQNRFVAGSDIHGANLKRACAELTWDQQQQEFAKFLLVNVFALHETYLRRVLADLGVTNEKIEKNLQFPTSLDPRGVKIGGIWCAIDEITTPESIMLKNGFYQRLSSHKKNSIHALDDLMKCYRYFKECRNSLAHNGAIADKKAETAYSNFSAIATTSALGVSEVPEHYPLVEGKAVELSLRGVVGFCDILLRIIVSLDAELARSEAAEGVFEKYWLKKHQRRYTLKTKEEKAKSNQIKFLINGLGLPKPERTEAFEVFLRKKQLVN